MFQTINPATGQILKNYEWLSDDELKASVQKAAAHFQLWHRKPLAERVDGVRRLADVFRKQKEELAQLMTAEMGKTHEEGISEIEKCADTFDYFADHANEFLKSVPVQTNGSKTEICFEAMGVILSVMPWNFPFWQFVRFAAPSLIIGNVILLKHSTITAGCAEKIQSLCQQAIDLQVIFNLPINHDQAAWVMQQKSVQGVTFTGSTRGGREVAKSAAAALKKTVLELGGSDAYIILADADIALAAKKCAAGRMINNGQSCVAAKRFIAVKEVYEPFVTALKAELEKHPTHPLAHEKFKTQLQEQVDKMKILGGKVLLGGKMQEGAGAFYPPSLIAFDNNVPQSHEEELFGPVAMVYKAADLEEAVAFANSSPYGLGGGIFSRNAQSAKELATTRLEAGFVTVNDTVRSDPRLPFGGVKDSGYGRELSEFGFREFCNIKTVSVGN